MHHSTHSLLKNTSDSAVNVTDNSVKVDPDIQGEKYKQVTKYDSYRL